jgi:hypothetical protein
MTTAKLANMTLPNDEDGIAQGNDLIGRAPTLVSFSLHGHPPHLSGQLNLRIDSALYPVKRAHPTAGEAASGQWIMRNAFHRSPPIDGNVRSPGREKLISGVSIPNSLVLRKVFGEIETVTPSWMACLGLFPSARKAWPTMNPCFVVRRAFARVSPLTPGVAARWQ